MGGLQTAGTYQEIKDGHGYQTSIQARGATLVSVVRLILTYSASLILPVTLVEAAQLLSISVDTSAQGRCAQEAFEPGFADIVVVVHVPLIARIKLELLLSLALLSSRSRRTQERLSTLLYLAKVIRL